MNDEESVSLRIDDSLATLSLGHPDERTVSLSVRRMESLRRALEQLQTAVSRGDVRGVVVRGATPKLFCVGADLKLLRLLQERRIAEVQQQLLAASELDAARRERLEQLREETLGELAEELAMLGKETFERLQSLAVPTVAAISGACLGGGLELALHCRWVIAAESVSIYSGSSKTELGFPEPMLGLLQGWGGIELTVGRLGLRRALPLLLQGKSITPEHAYKLGVVDAITSGDRLYDYAASVARGEVTIAPRRLGIVDRLLTSTSLGRRVVRDGISLPLFGRIAPGASTALADFPPHHYPAPHAILEVAQRVAASPADGTRLASKRFGELAMSPQSEALVHVLFFGTEAAKARAKSDGTRPQRKLNCLVVGAGQMGAGIAHALVRSGHKVTVHDSQDSSLAAARNRITDWVNNDRKLLSGDKERVLQNTLYEVTLSEQLHDFDFVIEAVIEDEQVKQSLFAQITPRLRDDAVVATNTSSIPISTLATVVTGPQRFFGMHYFNPVRQMRLVEIIRGDQTSDAAAALGAELAVAQGKFPVVVQDVPGFLVNRMLFPYLSEAMQMVLEGVPIDAIDRAAEEFGMFMGPLKTLDLVGFDVAREVASVLSAAYPERMRTPTLIGNSGTEVSWQAVLDTLRDSATCSGRSRGKVFTSIKKGEDASQNPHPTRFSWTVISGASSTHRRRHETHRRRRKFATASSVNSSMKRSFASTKAWPATIAKRRLCRSTWPRSSVSASLRFVAA